MPSAKRSYAASDPVMLVIGNLGRWLAKGRATPDVDHCHFAAPQDIDAELLGTVRPDFIVSALFGDGIDAMEIAETLGKLDYSGAYRAIATQLPNVSSVRSEIRSAAPALDFDILVLGSLPG